MLSSEDAASDVAALLAAVLVVLELLQAARESTSKAESANDTTFFHDFLLFSLYKAIIHQKRFDILLFHRVFQNETFTYKVANEVRES